MNYNTWFQNRLILIGESGCGKSHLAYIWALQHNAKIITPENNRYYFNPNTHYVIEDIDTINQDHEQSLFNIINLAQRYNNKILITAKSMAKFALPDLQSRINASSTATISKPDEKIIKAIIIKQLSDRQISIKKEVLHYIATRTKTSFHSIRDLISTLDQLSLQELKPITIPLVRRVL